MAKLKKTETPSDDEVPLSPEQAQLVGRVRWMMMISGFATLLGIAVVIGVIGYRVFRSEGSAPADMVARLPKGAKIVSTAVAGDRLLVTIDVQGSLEIRSFDAHSLRPAGRLTFANEP
jgi:hypothetical protein